MVDAANEALEPKRFETVEEGSAGAFDPGLAPSNPNLFTGPALKPPNDAAQGGVGHCEPNGVGAAGEALG